MNAEQLWAEYYSDFGAEKVMTKADFLKALPEYNPWVMDREPTREDGDVYGYIFIRRTNKNGSYRHDKIGWDEFVEYEQGTEWMRIPK
jgi:hypothetical protein